MRDRAAAVPVADQLKADPPHSRRRVIATVAAVALTAAGVTLGGVSASATPGTGGFLQAFQTDINSVVTDVAVDSYTAQAFAARTGGVAILDENSGDVTGTIP